MYVQCGSRIISLNWLFTLSENFWNFWNLQTCKLGVLNQLLKGSFNNYLDKKIPNFDDLPPSNRQFWIFYIPFVIKLGLSLFTYLFLACPRSYWMTPKCKGASWEKNCKYTSVKQLHHVRPYLIVSNRNLRSKCS